MAKTWRSFLVALGGASVCLSRGIAPAWAQHRRPFPEPPASAVTQNPAEARKPDPELSPARKEALLQNEREFRTGVERLFQLSSELREEVQKTATREVLSVGMYKKAEAIEKLAKQLKTKARI